MFALSLTLLIVSLEIPANYGELVDAFRQLPVFAVCFALLAMCWYYHYLYHRRYGLEDFGTHLLNWALLFAVLFYVYPLKFLFTLLFEMWFGIEATIRQPAAAEWPTVMLLYSGGIVAIFGIFSMMNRRALLLANQLELDEMEIVQTRGAMHAHLFSAGLGVVSMAIALFTPRWFPFAGAVYMLMGPLHAIHGFRIGRKVERLAAGR